MARRYSTHEKATLLRDVVFSANDGIITTFAVVAGATGAGLSSSIVIILGFANLLADGISMASGNYLGVKSEIEYQKEKDGKLISDHSPIRHGAVTFVSFIFVGFLPLFPYVFGLGPSFSLSVVTVAAALFLVGSLRSFYTKRNWFIGGAEMLFIGGLAAVVAYLVGYLLGKYIL